MHSVRFGGKKGKSWALVESDEHIVVRTAARAPLERTPLAARTRATLSGFAPVAQFVPAGVEVLRATAARGARSTRDAARQQLKKEAGVRFAGRCLVDRRSGEPVIYTENFFVKFDDDASAADVKRSLAKRKLAIKRPVRFARNGYFVGAPEGTGQAVFTIADDLLDDPAVELCHPELVRRVRRRSVFPGQWHLKAMSIDGRPIDADANVEAAWALTRGEGVTIAIIDDGFDLDHEEFRSPGKIVAPRDVTFDDTDPRPGFGNNHGTACAGVAAADGLFGASGVAPGARLMPIRCVSALGSMNEAEAFFWAVQNGADVISCSWGPFDGDWFDPSDPLHTAFAPLPDSTRLAIDHAVRNGRNGRGCVVLFAAGNGNESVDNDGYASYEKVIAVAACNHEERRSAYSDFGRAVWCCFPSNDLVPDSTGRTPPGIFTTDRSGHSGYNQGIASLGDAAGDYTNDFGGTSSACPGAAGAAALVLSRNPNLRWDEVRDILKRTADRIDTTRGAYNAEGHSDQYGYGRINAKKSVDAALTAAPASAATHAASGSEPIRDHKSASLSVPVGDAASLREVKVKVDIEHTYIGDLIVKLMPPAGTGVAPITLHNREGRGTDNLKRTYDAVSTPALAGLAGKSPKGTWRLVVEDKAAEDIGVLRAVALEMNF